jgi:hypothetical protein
MCNINRDAEMALLTVGINLISKAMEASLRDNIPQSTDVLAAATNAYQQGKITKAQFVEVINALDEQVYRTRAYAEPINQLDLYRR